MTFNTLRTPWPAFGGKGWVADEVWLRLGDVANYVEPFVRSAAILLRRPADHHVHVETINDLDGYVANFWRAAQLDPDAVAQYAAWPVIESDLHARHAWLKSNRDAMQRHLENDPEWFDAKIAGWWCWGMCCWIGGRFCAASCNSRQRPHLGNPGIGVNIPRVDIKQWMHALADRIRHVRVCCGDWTRVCTPSVVLAPTPRRPVGVFLDAPYSVDREPKLYRIDSKTVALAAREWAIKNGDNPRLRIAMCGIAGEHRMPRGWTLMKWSRRGGFGATAKRHDERIWFSPHCLTARRIKEVA